MPKTTANGWVVTRDILIAIFDMAGDWIYFYTVYAGAGDNFRGHAQYNLLLYVVLTVCTLGSILSLWAIVTSLGRMYRYKSLCCKCTVPRLAMSLILLHHVPQFILTAFIDLTFHGDMSWEGYLNIGSSMVALINTLSITKCGEGYCGNSEKANEDLEIATLTESVTSDYKRMSAVV
mmetsp:Transcript_14417/g.31338  ORF Transcript_14417/g.31338 Transcript_14417/m.31338 type:complete len:177 (+) Transcript_14417:197-727(+)|eukprot:CAMPEP_0172552820 /NCGR_PEP_ID=MMETSP1067-20121228/47213_1 /TAXON_ID=265564 ORGANISM="Thalassiosira punctigera, Strain Tpunct2005C2" /NCGR_SAMPLE_ID=MMETSP1067 /ASSEMBLY_ACC=CAM_ASM_000444 /LENGTH=176 /DNA_ID=CAMNT_0013340883 /DNA_START=157 /DNA_END=687 /DNA_ORIENTATION=+